MDAAYLITRLEQMQADRAVWEAHWQEVAELIAPLRAEFTTVRTPGEKRNLKIYDGTPGLAAENLASGLWGMLTNSANEWFRLRAGDDALDRRYEVRLWLDEVAARMRQAFAAGGQRFYTKAVDLYNDIVSLGTGVFYEDWKPGSDAPFFSTRHLAECYIAENAEERIDTLYRKFDWTARQIVEEWPSTAPEAIKTAAEKQPNQKFSILHCAWPNPERKVGRMGPAGMAFASHYVAIESKTMLEVGGYEEFPYQVPRWSTRSRGTYGDSPGQLALPDTKVLNAMAKTSLVAAQKQADPPILAADELAIKGMKMVPGLPIYGGVDETGRPRMLPFQSGGNVGLTLEMMDQRRNAIREAFYWSLLILVERPNATATEVLARQEEKLRLMGPHIGRIMHEFLDPLIDRHFALMWRRRRLPPPPAALLEAPQLRVEYVSPAARAQKVAEATAVQRFLDSAIPLAGVKPELLDNIEGDETLRVLADGYGVPTRILRAPEMVAQLRQQRQQAQAAQNMVAAAPPLAGALKDASQALATARQAT